MCSACLTNFRPDIVFHSAALKHVPILEHDCEEGVKTNVFGSVNVADAAIAARAAVLVMISTDKAIEPISVLGASKRLAEIYCQALDADLAGKMKAGEPRTRLISVRFQETFWPRTVLLCRNLRPKSKRAGRSR